MIRFAVPRLIPVVMAFALLGATIAVPANALDITAMNDVERAALRTEIRAYLLDNPEVIIEAVNILEQRQATAESSADLALVAENYEELIDDGYSWVGGNPDGDITLVEFMDYRCAYCRRAVPEVASLLAADGNIRLVVKELPILGEGSLISSQFAVAAKQIAGLDAYKQVHDALMDYTGEVSEVALRRLSDGLGLDTPAILAHMESQEVSDEIARTRALAARLKISGTPTFMLDNELLRGYLPADQLAVMVAEKRAAK